MIKISQYMHTHIHTYTYLKSRYFLLGRANDLSLIEDAETNRNLLFDPDSHRRYGGVKSSGGCCSVFVSITI